MYKHNFFIFFQNLWVYHFLWLLPEVVAIQSLASQGRHPAPLPNGPGTCRQVLGLRLSKAMSKSMVAADTHRTLENRYSHCVKKP